MVDVRGHEKQEMLFSLMEETSGAFYSVHREPEGVILFNTRKTTIG